MGTQSKEEKWKTENDLEKDSGKGEEIMVGGKSYCNQQRKGKDFCGGLMRHEACGRQVTGNMPSLSSSTVLATLQLEHKL